MEVNVYDFDKTIYNGDSTIDFYKYSLKNTPSIIVFLPKQLLYIVLYKLKIVKKEKMKETFFSFLKYIKDIDKEINCFWRINDKKIKEWYKNSNHKNDIIISASPEFLLKPCCDKLEVKKLIASKVNKQTGKFESNNCYGKEKVSRLFKDFPNIKIAKMYTDSYSDLPLLEIAKEGFIVKKNEITKYESSEKRTE